MTGSRLRTFTTDEARRIGEQIGVVWSQAAFDVEQLRIGMEVELEHGLHDHLTNVTDDEPLVTAKIALAHLRSRIRMTLRRRGGPGECAARTQGAPICGHILSLIHI